MPWTPIRVRGIYILEHSQLLTIWSAISEPQELSTDRVLSAPWKPIHGRLTSDSVPEVVDDDEGILTSDDEAASVTIHMNEVAASLPTKVLKRLLRQRHFPFLQWNGWKVPKSKFHSKDVGGFITYSRTGVGQSFHFQNRSTGLENSLLCIPSVMSVWLLTIFPQHHGTGPFHALMPVLIKICLPYF